VPEESPDDGSEDGPAGGSSGRGTDRDGPTVDARPELRPETWPDGAVVGVGDLPAMDPERQALRITDWRESDGELRPEFVAIPRETWARETAHHEAAGTVLAELNERFEEGFKVWVVPPDPDDPDDVGEVVVGYVVEQGAAPDGLDREPEFSMAELNDAVPDEVTGVAAAGTEHEHRIEGIPVVLERTLQ